MPSGYRTEPSDRRKSQEYAVVIFLPPDLDAMVAPYRDQYDPDSRLIGAHVSIVFPFTTPLGLDELSRIISTEVNRIGAMKVELSSVGDFYPQSPIIYWGVKHDSVFNALYKTLYAQLNIPLPHKTFVPHVTVAKEISPHRVMLIKERIVAYLPNESFWANAVDLVSPVAGNWVSVRTFPLAVP